jgi:hypothetical protein
VLLRLGIAMDGNLDVEDLRMAEPNGNLLRPFGDQGEEEPWDAATLLQVLKEAAFGRSTRRAPR